MTGPEAGLAVGRAGEVECGTCGARWPAARARFCGSCGAALTALPAVPGSPFGRRRLRLSARPVAALLVALALAVAVLAVEPGLTLRPTEQHVALPDPDDVQAGAGLSRDEAEAAVAPFSTDRLTCQPDGCERWRRPVREAWSRVAAVDGRLLLLDDGDLVGVDLDTGLDLWRMPVAGTIHAAGTGEAVPWRPQPHRLGITAGEQHFMLTDTTGVVQLRGADGRIHWTVQLPIRELWWVVTMDDLVVVTGAPTPARSASDSVVGALSAADGQVRWMRTDPRAELQHASSLGIVVHTGGDELEVLDPATGEVRFRHEAAEDTWLYAAGPWLVVERGHDGVPPPTELLDPADGTVAAVLPGRLDSGFVEVDGRFVGLVWIWEDTAIGTRGQATVVAVDRDGTLAWRHHLDDEADGDTCCPQVTELTDGTVLVRTGARGGAIALDVVSGQPRRDVPTPDLPEDAWFHDGLAFHHGGEGMTIYDGRGGRLEITGDGWPILTDPPVLANERELLGVRFLPDD